MMKSFIMWKMPVMLLGTGAALILAPASKAQEVSPDHFTDTGVQDVYQAAPAKATAPAAKHKALTSQARTPQTNSPATLQLAANRDSALPAKPEALAIKEESKTASPKPKKP
jgi:hypothetical protein